jgi:hypothetical protein
MSDTQSSIFIFRETLAIEEAVLIKMREGVRRSEAEVGVAVALTNEHRGDSIATILISFYVARCTIAPSMSTVKYPKAAHASLTKSV